MSYVLTGKYDVDAMRASAESSGLQLLWALAEAPVRYPINANTFVYMHDSFNRGY